MIKRYRNVSHLIHIVRNPTEQETDKYGDDQGVHPSLIARLDLYLATTLAVLSTFDGDHYRAKNSINEGEEEKERHQPK